MTRKAEVGRRACAAVPDAAKLGGGTFSQDVDALRLRGDDSRENVVNEEVDDATRLRSILDGQAEMIACTDAEDRLTFVNAALAEWSPVARVGASLLDLFAFDERPRVRAALAFTERSGLAASVVTGRAERRPIDWTIRARDDAEWLVVGRARPPRAADDDRAAMLREMDHRVKNNLQIVSSLLRLRLELIDDPASRGPLLDCQRRISALALAHEHLHRALLPGSIDASAYFGELVHDLLRGRPKVPRVELSIAPLSLRLDDATQLGLALSELVSNAIFHAWDEPESGTLSVVLSEANGAVLLSVRDDGRGVTTSPEASTTLGLRLVRQLAVQLGGEFVLTAQGGTSALLTLPRRSR